jgi:hypothetical protein
MDVPALSSGPAPTRSPVLLIPYDVREAMSVFCAAERAGKSETTIRGRCQRHHIGRRIGGAWAVSDARLGNDRLNNGQQCYDVSAADGGVLSIGGIWDEWKNIETGEIVSSCSMIIAAANLCGPFTTRCRHCFTRRASSIA